MVRLEEWPLVHLVVVVLILLGEALEWGESGIWELLIMVVVIVGILVIVWILMVDYGIVDGGGMVVQVVWVVEMGVAVVGVVVWVLRVAVAAVIRGGEGDGQEGQGEEDYGEELKNNNYFVPIYSFGYVVITTIISTINNSSNNNNNNNNNNNSNNDNL